MGTRYVLGKTLMLTIAGIGSVVPMANIEEHTQGFLVEWYGPQAPAHSIGDVVDRLNTSAASVSTDGKQVRLLTAMGVPADDYAFGVFAAESAALVAQVCQDAGDPAQRISSAVGWVRFRDR